MMIDHLTDLALQSILARLTPEQTLYLQGEEYNFQCSYNIAVRQNCDYARLYIPHNNDTIRCMIFIRKEDRFPVLMLIDEDYHELPGKINHSFGTKITENDGICQN